MNELISKQAAIDAMFNLCDRLSEPYNRCENPHIDVIVDELEQLSSAQPEIIQCKDCKYWNSGSCECREHAVNCQDYMVGDMETEAEHFCGYAERKEVTT